MIRIPSTVIRGQRITADFQNEILRALRQLRPIQGTNIKLEETAEGVRFSATPGTQTTYISGSSSETALPWQMKIDNEGNLYIYSPSMTLSRFKQTNTSIDLVENYATLGEGWIKTAFTDLKINQYIIATFIEKTNPCCLEITLEKNEPKFDNNTPLAFRSFCVGKISYSQGTDTLPESRTITQYITGTVKSYYTALGATVIGYYYNSNPPQLGNILSPSEHGPSGTDLYLAQLYNRILSTSVSGIIRSNPRYIDNIAEGEFSNGGTVIASAIPLVSLSQALCQDYTI